MKSILAFFLFALIPYISLCQSKLDSTTYKVEKSNNHISAGIRVAIVGDSEISGLVKYSFSGKSALQADLGRIIGPGILMFGLYYKRNNYLFQSKKIHLSYGIGGTVLRFKPYKDGMNSQLYIYPSVTGGIMYSFNRSPISVGLDARVLIKALSTPNYSGSIQNLGFSLLYSLGRSQQE